MSSIETPHTSHTVDQTAKKRHPLRTCGITILVMLAVGVGALVGFYVATPIPEPASSVQAQATKVYYSDGVTEIGSLNSMNRTIVDASAMSPLVRDAVVASEDPEFYERSGTHFVDAVKTLWTLATGGRSSTETLTQKYARIYYTTDTTVILGTMHEAFLPSRIDNGLSKDQILTDYLNTVYFGRGAYGIEAAAQTYFGVSAQDLTAAQAALLVGIMPAPSAWDPAVDADQARQQFDRVKAAMVRQGVLTQADADAAQFPTTKAYSENGTFQGTEGYLLALVREELVSKARLAEKEIDEAGFVVVTTIDKAMQDAAVAAIEALPKDRPSNNVVGLYSMNPKTGGAYAIYGGKDYSTNSVNAATELRAPAGTAFSAVTIAEAVENNIDLTSTFIATNGIFINSEEGWQYQNFDGRDYGMLDVFATTKHAVNTSLVNLNEMVGPHKTLTEAIDYGLAQDTPNLDDSIDNVLGKARVTDQEMARIYGIFANGGTMVEPHVVATVATAQGNVIFREKRAEQSVLERSDADVVTNVLTQPFTDGGYAFPAAKELVAKRPAAGQIGNTMSNLSATFTGYVPQMVASVSMVQIGDGGALEELSGFGGVERIYGNSYPAQVWASYMSAATAQMPVKAFPERPRE